MIFFILLLIFSGYLFYKFFNNNSSDSSYSSSTQQTLDRLRIESKDKLSAFLNDKPNIEFYIDERNVLIVDFETTGLPISRDAPISDIDNWPRIVSASLLLYTKNGKLIEEYYTLIKQLIAIPQEAVDIHKISTEEANSSGISFKEFSLKLQYFSDRSSVFCAHNIDFDYKVLQADLKRNKFKNYFSKHKKICTKLKGRRVTGRNNKLLNLVEECYGATLLDNTLLHNASVDSRLTAACFFYMLDMEYINDDIFN